jgi:hypothetical protein
VREIRTLRSFGGRRLRHDGGASSYQLTPTPDANTFSYTDDFTVTTKKGVVKTHNVGIFDVATGLFSEIARIDPNASTGNFAGATGVLYINGTSADGGATFQAEIPGEICFVD